MEILSVVREGLDADGGLPLPNLRGTTVVVYVRLHLRSAEFHLLRSLMPVTKTCSDEALIGRAPISPSTAQLGVRNATPRDCSAREKLHEREGDQDRCFGGGL